MSDEQVATMLTHIAIRWRKNGFGRPECALYIGRIYAGQVDMVSVRHHPDTLWRAWIMNSDEGSELAWRATEKEAKDGLFHAVSIAVMEAE